MAQGLIIEGGKVKVFEPLLESRLRAKSVMLTNGTFLNRKIHIGEKQFVVEVELEKVLLTEDLINGV
jgi:tRNA uridine 5-carboxymethylaminomethyl modification enzyme